MANQSKEVKAIYKDGKVLTIPHSTFEISMLHSLGKADLIAAILPEGVQSIGDYAFYGCESL